MQTGSCIVIPAYQPNKLLPDYVRALRNVTDSPIIVVDDGSDPACRPWFEQSEAVPGVTLLRHEQNRGKGAALKTAFIWIRRELPQTTCVVTADCDGQHSVEDVMRVIEACHANPGALVLGCRTFGPETPKRSLRGNRFTSCVMKILYNIDLEDTQTGLRGIPACMLGPLCTLRGERYEYELNMLILARREIIPMVVVPIQTIYFNNNAGSHYRTVADSLRVAGQMFRGLGQYGLSSTLSAVIDVFLYAVFVKWIMNALPQSARILLGGLAARLISSVVNYTMNRRLPYVQTKSVRQTAGRYYALWFVQMICSVFGAWLLALLGLGELLSKWIVDLLLAVASYQVQLRWVFAKRGELN